MTHTGKRKSVGLALGGGVVRGMAHVGVLSTLRRSGIPIDYVAGTSAGAIMGALFCAGMTAAEVEYIGSKVGWRDIARPVWPSRGLVSFAPLENLLRDVLGDITFADLYIPFAAVTTNMQTGKSIVLQDGPLAPAVRASSSVPGFVTPVSIGPYLLGDGALSNNLPVSVAREMGADVVIAVDIFQPAFIRGWGALGLGLTALEILINRAGGGVEAADILIQPALSGISYLLFSQRERLIDLGREAAEAALPAIQAILPAS